VARQEGVCVEGVACCEAQAWAAGLGQQGLGSRAWTAGQGARQQGCVLTQRVLRHRADGRGVCTLQAVNGVWRAATQAALRTPSVGIHGGPAKPEEGGRVARPL